LNQSGEHGLKQGRRLERFLKWLEEGRAKLGSTSGIEPVLKGVGIARLAPAPLGAPDVPFSILLSG